MLQNPSPPEGFKIKIQVQNVLDFWTLYLPLGLESAYELLGPHPFQKLDIVIVPRCYSGLGKTMPLKRTSIMINAGCPFNRPMNSELIPRYDITSNIFLNF